MAAFSNSNNNNNNKRQQNVLVLWDFDWSFANHNTDRYPFHVHWGTNNNVGLNKLASIRNAAKEDAKAAGKEFNFTEFMNERGWPMLFDKNQSNGNKTLSFNDFEEILGSMPIFDENLHIAKTLYQYTIKNGAKNENNNINCEQIIVSNANQVLCDIVLTKHGIKKHMNQDLVKYPIFGNDNIYTNTGIWKGDKNGLFVRGFHNEENPHFCNYCEPNLCKGTVLFKHILEKKDPFETFKIKKDDSKYASRVGSASSLQDVEMKDADRKELDNEDDEVKSDALSIDENESENDENVNDWFIDERYNHIDTFIYIGDGANDFCPISKLRRCDFAFVRKDFALDELISENNSDNKYFKEISANIMKWENGKELLALFEKAIPQLDWNMDL